ncbi:MAG: ankyrin repeat domain-containing protein [Deferribacteraceae bacterium]|jgi:ankyrin repeat protein|nr:ankyrin repeat domain-containing protein [Deferribacteraceae bacterium]
MAKISKLLDAVKKKNVAAVKELVAAGANPNEALALSREPVSPYSYAITRSIWAGAVSNELLEIVEFLTPLAKDHYFRKLEGNDFKGHTFYPSYFEDAMIFSEAIGDHDVVLEAMLRGGYPFDKDPNLGRYIGNVSFPLAKTLLDKWLKSDTDGGTSVCSAVKAGNLELLSYLLDKGVTANQPMYYSNGSGEVALVTAIRMNNIDAVKKLVAAGADTKLKDTGYDKNAIEMAASLGNDAIIELVK